MTSLYFLGGGNMCRAIVSGLYQNPDIQITVIDKDAEKRSQLEADFGIKTDSILPELNQDDVLILAVKPQHLEDACKSLVLNQPLVLSIVAGVSIATLASWLKQEQRIIRIMPNMAAAVGLSASGLFASEGTEADDKTLALTLMTAVGTGIWLAKEDDLNTITALSGSGPAYVFYFMNALSAAAQKLGMDEKTAYDLTLKTLEGAVLLAKTSGQPFKALQDSVTSEGGTTYAALSVFEADNMAKTLEKGVNAAYLRSKELSK